MFCLLDSTSRTSKGINWGKFSRLNSIVHDMTRLNLFGIFLGIVFHVFSINNFSLWRMFIFAFVFNSLIFIIFIPNVHKFFNFNPIVFAILTYALFTGCANTIFSAFIFAKFIDGFCFFTTSTSFFHFNLFKTKRHHLTFAVLSRNEHLHKIMAFCRQIKNAFVSRQSNYIMKGSIA